MKNKNDTPLALVDISPEKLRAARGARSLSEVASLTGVSKQQICNCESGQSKPSAVLLLRLCLLYGVDVKSLASVADIFLGVA